MKKFKTIIMLLLNFVLIDGIFAMEASVKRERSFVKLSDESTKLIEYYVVNNIRYYNEYKAQKKGNDILFLGEGTDFLPIEKCGDIKFFVSSAITGSQGNPGAAYIILDPAITQMRVVRGVAQSNNTGVNIYLGLDPNKVELGGYKGRDKTYLAHVMMVQSKEKSGSDSGISWYNQYFPLQGQVKHLGSQELALEARKYLSPQDINWKSPIFQKKVKELLGDRAKNFDFEKGCLIFRENYWTNTENKLKGITYNSAKK